MIDIQVKLSLARDTSGKVNRLVDHRNKSLMYSSKEKDEFKMDRVCSSAKIFFQ